MGVGIRRMPPGEQITRAVGEMPEVLQAFFWTARYSGLRLFEVAALERGHVLREETQTLLHVPLGKGGREGWSVLFEPGLTWLEHVVAGLRPYQSRVFENAAHGAWDRKSVNKHWTRARLAAGMEVSDSTNFHFVTRHWHATWLLDRGASEMDVAFQMRHVRKNGMPNTDLVRQVYGRPDRFKALARAAQVAA